MCMFVCHITAEKKFVAVVYCSRLPCPITSRSEVGKSVGL